MYFLSARFFQKHTSHKSLSTFLENTGLPWCPGFMAYDPHILHFVRIVFLVSSPNKALKRDALAGAT